MQAKKNLIVLEAKTDRSDILGALASSLCLVHCLATPFIFAAHAGMAGHGHHAPAWWSFIDSALLIVSFFAVIWAARRSQRQWMKTLLFASWGLLALIILNEKLELFHLLEEAIYPPAIALVGLHLYNQRYCKCTNDQCCVDPQSPIENPSQ